MSKLSEFYALRDSLANDSEVTDTQWSELEQKLIREEILPEMQEQLKCILSRVQSPLSIHVDYTPNENLAISCTPYCIQTSLSMCTNTSKSINHPTVEVPVVEDVIVEEPVDTDDTNDSEDAITRGPRQYFSVRLNGKMVEGKNGAQILARTIQQIGYKRVAALGIMFGDGKYNLVDRNQRTDDGLKWQQPMGEWFIYSNMSNPRKIAVLQEIAQKLDLDMQITSDEQMMEYTLEKPVEIRIKSWNELEIGDCVKHATLGKGVITTFRRSDGGEKTYITIKYDYNIQKEYGYTEGIMTKFFTILSKK